MHLLGQHVGSKRLLEHDPLEADGALPPEILHRVTGHKENRERRPAFPQTPRQLNPTNSRHHQVGQHEIGLLTPIHQLESGSPT